MLSGMITPYVRHRRGVRGAVLMRNFFVSFDVWLKNIYKKVVSVKGLQIIEKLRFRIS